MAPESLETAERGESTSPTTPSPYKGGSPSSTDESTPLKKGMQGKADPTGRNTSEPATNKSTVSATQAGSYATTKSVGQIAVGTALITQNTALLRQLRTAPPGSSDHVLNHLLVASIVINAISIVLSVLLATANQKQKATPGTGTSSTKGTPPQGTVVKLIDDAGTLNSRLQAMDPAGTHFYSAWLTYANVLVTLLGTVLLILNAVITGLAPLNSGSQQSQMPSGPN